MLRNLLREIFSILVWVAVIFLGTKVFYAYVMEPFVVDGRSMEQTLHNGERMFMMKLNEVDRFDIVVFPAPGGPIPDNEPPKLYIKRVIGMPGDSISYQDDKLILNGQVMDEPYLEGLREEYDGNFTGDFSLADFNKEGIVPEGKLFVMGDNRRNSLDGRAFGFIDIEDVIGEANYIYWPLEDMRTMNLYELNADGSAIIERN